MSGEIVKRLNQLQKELSEERLAQEGFNFFFRKTPIKSGNARSNTNLNDNTIQANYAYARRLDEGASRQAPNGMTQPTIDYIKNLIDKTSKG